MTTDQRDTSDRPKPGDSVLVDSPEHFDGDWRAGVKGVYVLEGWYEGANYTYAVLQGLDRAVRSDFVRPHPDLNP